MKLPTDPAAYPAKHVTPSCWPIEQSSFFLLTTFRYKKSTECSNVENITMETAKKIRTILNIHFVCEELKLSHWNQIFQCHATQNGPMYNCIFEYSAWLAWKKSIVILLLNISYIINQQATNVIETWYLIRNIRDFSPWYSA